MPLYRVDIQANFLVNATTRDVVANRVRRMFAAGQFDQSDFEWGVAALTKGEVPHEQNHTAVRGQPRLPH